MPTIHYHAGCNTPGYMPMDDEPYTFDAFDDAKADLIDTLKRDEDHHAMGDDEYTATECANAAEEVNLWSSPDVIYVASEREHDLGLAYWIVGCAEEECTTEEGN